MGVQRGHDRIRAADLVIPAAVTERAAGKSQRRIRQGQRQAFSIAGLRANGPITIRDCANVNTSFPEFRDLATKLGLALTSF